MYFSILASVLEYCWCTPALADASANVNMKTTLLSSNGSWVPHDSSGLELMRSAIVAAAAAAAAVITAAVIGAAAAVAAVIITAAGGVVDVFLPHL